MAIAQTEAEEEGLWLTQTNLLAETRTTEPATEEAAVATTTPVLELYYLTSFKSIFFKSKINLTSFTM